MTNDLLIKSYLKRLRLPYIAQSYSQLAKEAAADNQPYQDYLLALLEGEVLQREENAQKLRLAKAHFPVFKTLDSHLAISLGVCACRQGKRVRFYTAANLSNELLEAQSQLRLSKLEASLARYDLIILDELGFIPFSKEGAEALFSFCASRYERGSLIITTCPLEGNIRR